ncbi:MAG: hypothetical protein QG656_1265, partial [Candidatus Hydrogenedentes bacterium]|nr:hypothetical protein [Candidatus Hydrogenedentota bacterium]
MSEDLQARFAKAQQDVTTLSERPGGMELLRLYAFYKQATAGDNTGARPGILDQVGRHKYDGWKALAGMSKED